MKLFELSQEQGRGGCSPVFINLEDVSAILSYGGPRGDYDNHSVIVMKSGERVAVKLYPSAVALLLK